MEPVKALFRQAVSSANGSSRFARATSSPETIRKALSAASSVLSISAKAAESQSSSGRPGKLRKPITATDRRTCTGGRLVSAAVLFSVSVRGRRNR